MQNELTVRGPDVLARALTADLVDEWLRYEAGSNDASENTVTTYKRSFGVFLAWLADRGLTLGDVSPLVVGEFKTDLKQTASVQTVNLRLTSARRFFAWAVVTGRALVNPVTDVKGVKRSGSRTHKRDTLTNAEVRAVLDGVDTQTLAGLRDKCILVLFAFCGLRTVEVHRANVGDLRTKNDRLCLFIQGKGRGEADEFAVIPLAWEPVIRQYARLRAGRKGDPLFVSCSPRTAGDRLSTRAVRGLVKKYYGLAGVVGPGKSTHSLRHTAITNAIRHAERSGRSPLAVKSFARHASMDTTLGYYHEAGRLADPVEDLIDYSNGG